MFRKPIRQKKSNAQAIDRRQAIVLLIVITMLGLFSIVALSFVYYAQSQATASRLSNATENVPTPDVNPEQLLGFFSNQLIYGVKNDAAGVRSALRGHSLADTMYGYHPLTPSTIPFNGSGRLHYPSPAVAGQDDYRLINYTFYNGDTFVRDPGYGSTRNDPYTNPDNSKFYGGGNAPYTYPDLNSLFLGALNANGEVLVQSFHRPWLFGPLDASNPNWTTPEGRYLTLRPRPQEHPEFPMPEDGGGDVRNFPFGPGMPIPGNPGKYYNNDSIWMDLGYPVQTASNGLRYKPLFAAFIVDLDNKINLNVHGNLMANDNHGSHQGWGAWAVNLSRVLNENGAPNPVEWKQLFKGSTLANGRYGANGKPNGNDPNNNVASSGGPPRVYSQVDFDGFDPNGPGNYYQLPGEATNPNYALFPTFPNTRYGNGNLAERTDHALLYNYFLPQQDDRRFHPAEMEALLRYGDTGSQSLSSELFKLMPTNLRNPRTRRMVTTLSMDVGRPGASPWLTGSGGLGDDYQLLAGNLFPNGDARAPADPLLNLRKGEFGLAAKSAIAALGQVDINRVLSRYPAPDATTFRMNDNAAYQQAVLERQNLARDLFIRLAGVTMGRQPHDPFPDKNTDKQRYNALRWLAQLSVNMVDYVDTDSFITPFHWDVNDPNEGFVFGTEIPQVVLNEVYAQIDNDKLDRIPPQPNGNGPQKDYLVQFWVELFNPLSADNTMFENGNVRLQVPETFANAKDGWPAYQIAVVADPKDPVQLKNFRDWLRDPENPMGDPSPKMNPNLFPVVAQTDQLTNGKWTVADPTVVLPSNNNFSGPSGGNEGFYVIGPDENFPFDPGMGMNPNPIQATLRLDHFPGGGPNNPDIGMTYTLPKNTPRNPANLPDHTVFLRRLLCPYMPLNNDPTSPTFNPYITVDYMEGVTLNDAIINSQPGVGGKPPEPIPNRKAVGRYQPFAGEFKLLKFQAAGNVDQPQHTMFRHNSTVADPKMVGTNDPTLQQPFDWLVHLDRQVISPMEILHVNSHAPHLLTQYFYPEGNLKPSKHTAPWFEPKARLYRFLEMLQTESRATDIRAQGRVPGKININTIWDEEIFQALCDAQTGGTYDQAAVKAMFDQMIKLRSPNGFPGDVTQDNGDRPFLGLAAPHALKTANNRATGLQDTFLRNVAGDEDVAKERLFAVPGQTHPYRKMELMTKIFNNVTTRSNVFAVWVTVGFFEVDSQGRLGKEIGKDENRHSRYRMFSIIDRTQMGALPAPMTTLSNAVATPGTANFSVASNKGTVTTPTNTGNVDIPVRGYDWEILPGMSLVIGRGTANEETIVVGGVPGNLVAHFARPHAVGETVSLSGVTGPTLPDGTATVNGHPGHMPAFHPQRFPGVIPYFTVVE